MFRGNEGNHLRAWVALSRCCWWVLLVVGLVGALLGLWLYEIHRGLPNPAQALATRPAIPSIRIVDRQGRLLYEALPNDARYTPLPPDAIPACIKQATVAVEDASFYQNPGIDLRGLLRALWLDVRAHRVVAGGSTITQQLARNLLLPPQERHRRTLRRKLRETLLAWRLTRRLSKDQILTLYLNTTYYGGFAYGIEAAAQTFFGKPASQLTLPECALLAGLPQAPSAYDPLRHPNAARRRQKVVLDLMVKQGFITPAERDRALSVPLTFNSTPYPLHAPHFVWMVLQRIHTLQAKGRLPADEPLVVHTTLDLDIQALAESAVRRHLQALQRRDLNVNDAAVVVLDAHTGALRALVGSADYTDPAIRGAVNMAVIPRPTGSAFKPFIYAAALDPHQPEPWTEATVLWDVPTVFRTRDGKPYTPENYDRRYHGPVTMRQALASSLNIPAVKALAHVGLPTILDIAQQLGITSLENAERYDLSLALGGGEVSLLELSGAYDAFVEGIFHPGWWLYEVQDQQNTLHYHPLPPAPRRVWDTRVAWLISDILSDDTARALGFPRHTSLEVGFPAAVKTGTSSAFHDNWTVGYTTDWVVGVWVGNADFQAMHGVDGLTGAAPIWHDILVGLHRQQPPPPFPRPPGLVRREVCTLSGLLPTPACPQTHLAWFIAGTEPTRPDDIYQRITLQTPNGPQTITALNLPPIAWDWARAHGWPLVQDIPSEANNEEAPPVILRTPPDGSVYRLNPDLSTTAQKIPVEAETTLQHAQLRLWADNTLLAECRDAPTCKAWWALEAGKHHFWAEAILPNGKRHRSVEVTVSVEK